MAKSAAERKRESDARKRETGVEEKTITFTTDTLKILDKLAEMSGYDLSKTRNKSVIYSRVLGQVVFEAYSAISENKLDKNRQEGFFVAQQASNLLTNDISYRDIPEYIQKYPASDFANTDSKKWRGGTIKELIEGYGDLFDYSNAIKSRKARVKK